MKKQITALVFIISLAFFASAAQGTTHDFYKGQTVRILVGFSAGGAAGALPGLLLHASHGVCDQLFFTVAPKVS